MVSMKNKSPQGRPWRVLSSLLQLHQDKQLCRHPWKSKFPHIHWLTSIMNRDRTGSVGRAFAAEREVLGYILGAKPILRNVK